MNLPLTDVRSCTSSSGKTLGLKQLQLPDLASSGGPPDGARIVHHGTDELPAPEAQKFSKAGIVYGDARYLK